MGHDARNPYAPPTTDATAPTQMPDHDDFVDATGGQRFGAYLIDLVCIFAFMFMIAVVFGVIDELTGSTLTALFDSNLLSYLLYATFYILVEGATGRSPGKMFVGTTVISTRTGTRPSFGTIVGRSFARLIPFEPLSYFFAAGMWHDTISDTRVVQKM